MPAETDRRWSLTAHALDGLLSRLDSDRETAAREYDAIRRKLVGFFERRDAATPESLADETIDRVARKLEEGENVEHLRAYFYGVAKRVMMEAARRRSRQEKATWQLPVEAAAAAAPGWLELELEQEQLGCLERCLGQLPGDSRVLIVSYYQSRADARRELAARMGMTYTGLKSQAHRIRGRLGTCVQQCLDAPGGRRSAERPRESRA